MIYCNNNKKIKSLKNKKNIVIITDFDNTLTTAKSDNSIRNDPIIFRWRRIRKTAKII